MPLKKSSKYFGDLGEEYALKLLKNKGYIILTKKFRSRFGEIDIVATYGDTLVFVEVKTRWSDKFGSPEEAVTPRKIYKIKSAGEYYCLIHPNLPTKLRIAVVAIEISAGRVESAKIISAD